MSYLITWDMPASDRRRSEKRLHELIDEYGPVVSAYPHWHPLVASSEPDRSSPATLPDRRAGYEGLDHDIYLRNAFITCPYNDGKRVIESVQRMNRLDDKLRVRRGEGEIQYALRLDRLHERRVAFVSAEVIDVPLYMPNATPILVKCNWRRSMESDGTIPKSIAVPLLLEMELPCWRTPGVAETWETMRKLILGSPCGSRSSLFVNQETGQTLKSIWNSLIDTGMFGKIYDR